MTKRASRFDGEGLKIAIIEEPKTIPKQRVRVGNVYKMRGGRAAAHGDMKVLIAVRGSVHDRNSQCLFLVISQGGEPMGVTNYGLHYVQDLYPVGFVEGLENLTLKMRYF